jgi:hypothetical protein
MRTFVSDCSIPLIRDALYWTTEVHVVKTCCLIQNVFVRYNAHLTSSLLLCSQV